MKVSQVLLCAAAAVFAALPAAAASSKTLPAIDLQARCKKSEATIVDMMGDQSLRGSAFDLCLKSEQQARDALQAAWPEIPPAYKSFCIRPAEFSASYVEWIACIEMMIDVKKLRTREGSTPGGPADSSRECPMISYAEDGSITSVLACAQTGRRR